MLSARFPKQIAATTFESLNGGQIGEFLAIIIDALDGNDTITVGPAVQKSVCVDAGAAYQATPATHRRIFPPARILRRAIVFMFGPAATR